MAHSQFLASIDQFVAIRSRDITLVFVHAKNSYILHRALWSDLHNIFDVNLCILGDFNIAIGAHERSSIVISQHLPMEEFRTFIAMMDLFYIHYTRNTFTWSLGRATELISARLDCALVFQGFFISMVVC